MWAGPMMAARDGLESVGLHTEIATMGDWLSQTIAGPALNAPNFAPLSVLADPGTCRETSNVSMTMVVDQGTKNTTVMLRPMASPGDVLTLLSVNENPAPWSHGGVTYQLDLTNEHEGIPAIVQTESGNIVGGTALNPDPYTWGKRGRNTNGYVHLACKGQPIGSNQSQGAIGGALVSDYRAVRLGSTASVVSEAVSGHSVLEQVNPSDFGEEEEAGGIVMRMGGLMCPDVTDCFADGDVGLYQRCPERRHLRVLPAPTYPYGMPDAQKNLAPASGKLWISSFCDLRANTGDTVERIDPSRADNGSCATDIFTVPDYEFTVRVPYAAANASAAAMAQGTVPIHGFPAATTAPPVFGYVTGTHLFQKFAIDPITGLRVYSYVTSTSTAEVAALPMPAYSSAQIANLPTLSGVALDPIAGRANVENKSYYPFDGPLATIEGMVSPVAAKGQVGSRVVTVKGSKVDDMGEPLQKVAYIGTLIEFTVAGRSTTHYVGPTFLGLSMFGLQSAGTLTSEKRHDSIRRNDFPYCNTPWLYWGPTGQATDIPNCGWQGGWMPQNPNVGQTNVGMMLANYDFFSADVGNYQRTGVLTGAPPATNSTVLDANNAVWWPHGRADNFLNNVSGAAPNSYKKGFANTPNTQPYRYSKPVFVAMSGPYSSTNDPATLINAAIDANGNFPGATPLYGAMPALGVPSNAGKRGTYGVYGASPVAVNYPPLVPISRAWVPDAGQFICVYTGGVGVAVSSLTGFSGWDNNLRCWQQSTEDSRVKSLGPVTGYTSLFIRSSRANGYDLTGSSGWVPNSIGFGGNAHHVMQLPTFNVQALSLPPSIMPMMPIDINTSSAFAQPFWYDLENICFITSFRQVVPIPQHQNPYAAVIAVVNEIGIGQVLTLEGLFSTQYQVDARRVALTNQRAGQEIDRKVDPDTAELGRAAWLSNPGLSLLLTKAAYNAQLRELDVLTRTFGSPLLGALNFIHNVGGSDVATHKLVSRVAQDALAKFEHLAVGSSEAADMEAAAANLRRLLGELPFVDARDGNAAPFKRHRPDVWR